VIKNQKPRQLFNFLKTALVTAIFLFAIGPHTTALGSNPTPYQLSLIQSAQGWLNQLKTFRAKFTQTTSTGSNAIGEVLIFRPGKMLIEYQDPDGLQIFSDGTWLIYIDKNLKEVNQIPLKVTPARVLLQKKINLMEKTRISIGEDDANFHLTLRPEGNSDDGNITLVFSKRPLLLISWAVTDPQGIKTTVLLDNISINIPIDQTRLTYSPPEWAFD